MCIRPHSRQDVHRKYIDFQYLQCSLEIIVDELMNTDFITLSQSCGCLMVSRFHDVSFFLLPACQSIFVFDALHRQCGSSVTDNQHPASDRREGRIHGVALSATFVTPVTSCRRRLTNGAGCGRQEDVPSRHTETFRCVCVCAHPSSTPSPPPPPPPSFAIRLLIVSVRHWKRVRAAQNTMQWFAKWQFLKGS